MFRHRHEDPQSSPVDMGPHKYQMREKLLTIGDDFWIETDRGNKAYKVDGKVLRARNTLNLEDAHGHVVAQVQERWLHVRDTMAIEHDGQKIAEVHKALIAPLRERFTIDLAGRGDDMEAQGNILAHEYTISQRGKRVAEISKKWFRLRETYGIEVEPNQDDPLIITATICIDQLAENNG